MGFSSSFVLIQKKKKQEEKIKATSPGLLRKGRSGAEKRTRFVALRSNSIFQHRPSIPPLTPLRLGRSFISYGFFIRQGASLLAFCSGFALPSALLVCYLLVIRYCFLAVSDKYYIHRKNASEVRTKHCDDRL